MIAVNLTRSWLSRFYLPSWPLKCANSYVCNHHGGLQPSWHEWRTRGLRTTETPHQLRASGNPQQRKTQLRPYAEISISSVVNGRRGGSEPYFGCPPRDTWDTRTECLSMGSAGFKPRSDDVGRRDRGIEIDQRWSWFPLHGETPPAVPLRVWYNVDGGS